MFIRKTTDVSDGHNRDQEFQRQKDDSIACRYRLVLILSAISMRTPASARVKGEENINKVAFARQWLNGKSLEQLRY